MSEKENEYPRGFMKIQQRSVCLTDQFHGTIVYHKSLITHHSILRVQFNLLG